MVHVLALDSQFQQELTTAGTKLVVVDFFATWCGPCRNIAPYFEQLPTKYPRAVFIKVDVDKCPETAQSNGVTAMPSFIFFRNKAKIDSLRGADVNVLEEKIKKWYGSDDGDASEDAPVKGHMDLNSMLNTQGCECLNESDDHPLAHALTSKGGYLESDCDEQLIIAIAFNQSVKLHSMKLHGPADKGPKRVKLFINQPSTIDFDTAESREALQQFDLTPEEIQEGNVIPLRFVKFQNVQNVTVFILDNQQGEETTQIDYISFIGSPLIGVTNMNEFKRVAGKKGESE